MQIHKLAGRISKSGTSRPERVVGRVLLVGKCYSLGEHGLVVGQVLLIGRISKLGTSRPGPVVGRVLLAGRAYASG